VALGEMRRSGLERVWSLKPETSGGLRRLHQARPNRF
jgi:hypothetical protein